MDVWLGFAGRPQRLQCFIALLTGLLAVNAVREPSWFWDIFCLGRQHFWYQLPAQSFLNKCRSYFRLPRSFAPPKFNSSPFKSYRDPIGKDRLPTTIFRGELRSCYIWGVGGSCIFVSLCSNWLLLHLQHSGSAQPSWKHPRSSGGMGKTVRLWSIYQAQLGVWAGNWKAKNWHKLPDLLHRLRKLQVPWNSIWLYRFFWFTLRTVNATYVGHTELLHETLRWMLYFRGVWYLMFSPFKARFQYVNIVNTPDVKVSICIVPY